jgi:hypothetical protein
VGLLGQLVGLVGLVGQVDLQLVVCLPFDLVLPLL